MGHLGLCCEAVLSYGPECCPLDGTKGAGNMWIRDEIGWVTSECLWATPCVVLDSLESLESTRDETPWTGKELRLDYRVLNRSD